MARTTLQRTAPVLVVTTRTMKPMRDFFVETLGFTVDTEAGKGPAFVTLDRDGQTVMLECRPVFFAAKKTWTIYFWVDDIEAAYAEFTGRDAVLKGPIVDKFYGCREIAVIAPDGRVIVFGQLGAD